MNTLLSSLTLTLFSVVPAFAITVQTPVNGATVTSPFQLTASTQTCDSKPAASMGYSMDSGSTTIVSTSFTAIISASAGKHILHVKCWGTKVNEDQQLSLTVAPPSPVLTPGFSLASGTYTGPQTVSLSDSTPGALVYYTTNGSAPSASSIPYAGPIAISSSTVIEAIATSPGYSNSGLARADIVIKPAPSSPVIPPNAIAANGVQALSGWQFNHDAGTPGTASGTSALTASPSLSGSARQFSSTYTNGGGEIYSVVYANDTTSSNFVYDGWVWIAQGSQFANLEMDSNQVDANGNTYIYAFQCSAYSHMWEYSGAGASWVASTQACDISSWTTNAWHHVQISYSRDDAGYVTYHSVWVDSIQQVIEATVPSSFALGWKVGVVQTQFQVDGLGASGSSTLYLDNLTIYRW